EGLGKRIEALGVARAERHLEPVRRDESVDAHCALQIHFPAQPSAQLHGLQPASERFGEGALDQAFEATLELLQSHAAASIAMGIPRPSDEASPQLAMVCVA